MGQIFVRASRRARAYSRRAGSRSAKVKKTIASIERHVLLNGGNLSAVRTSQLLHTTRNKLYQSRARDLGERILKRRAKGGLSYRRESQLKSLQARLTTMQYKLKY